MKRFKQFYLIFLLIWMGCHLAEAESVYETQSGYRIFCDELTFSSGSEVEVPLYLANRAEMKRAFQVDIFLPTGLTPEVVVNSSSLATPVAPCSIVSTWDNNSRTLRLVVTGNANWSANSKLEFAHIKLKSDSELQSGTTIDFENFIFTRVSDNKGYYGTLSNVEITVSSPKATSLTLENDELEMVVGEFVQLHATVLPANASQQLNWSSSKPAVATIDNTGKLNAVSEGTTVVVASTTDGTNLTAVCIVNVRSADVSGDLNNDGVVDVTDVNIAIDIVLGKNKDSDCFTRADVNNDGMVDVTDVDILIDIILGKSPSIPQTQTYKVNGVTFKMVPIQGGTFTMGGTAEQPADMVQSYELPTHQVTLSDFSIGQTQVTQELWQAVMGSNPSSFTDNLQNPVEQVNWNDCLEFISKLNALTGQQFRLPTEAEWEFAARGGNKSRGTVYAGSNDVNAVCWYIDNSDNSTHPVAKKSPNELGLYDMGGNVWEWCSDYWSTYKADAQTNPTGPATGSFIVCRGGGWHSEAENCRTSARTYNAPTRVYNRIGVRLAK